MNQWTIASACAATVLTLTACSTNSASSSATYNSHHATAINAAPFASVTNKLLQAYHWDLDAAYGPDGAAQPLFKSLQPQEKVRLNFMAGANPGEQFVATKVCNHIRGDYVLEGSQFKLGRLMSTQMACVDNGIAQLERAVGNQLGKLHTVQLVQGAPTPKIALGFSDGSRWHMTGTPTDTTRYGSAGEVMFLEVAPHTKPCTSGVARTQCLQVREIKYDSAGRKTVASDWQNFHQSIQGFTHQPGTRNVLRIKRYPIQNPPADGSSFAYVLDLRVETELERP